MKKYALSFLVLAVGVGFLGVAEGRPDRPYGPAGCGLGNVLFGKKDNQVIAATTNDTSFQSFAISSGTSNCVDNGVVKKKKEVSLFIEANSRSLANDMARGQGESVVALSNLLGCSDAQLFGSELQKSYGEIYPSVDEKPWVVETRIRSTVKQHPALRGACTAVQG